MVGEDRRVLLGSSRYRRLVAARAVSSLGNGITPIALAFGVLDLPGATPTSLSIVLAAQAVPLVVLLPIGGVIADRLGRARVAGTADAVASVVVMGAAVLFLTGSATVPLLAAISAAFGCLAALWYPAMGALVPDVVEDVHLQAGNAYVSVANNGGLIMGNAVGGVLVATIGPGPAIAIDALTFLAAGLLVLSFRSVSRPHRSEASMVGDLSHGWRVFWSYRWVVVVVGAFSVIVMSWRGSQEVMGPVLAREAYGGAAGWATIMACESAGMLVGALVASRLRVRRPLLFGMLITLALPVLQLALAFALPLGVVAATAFGWGLSMELFFVLWLVALQTHVPREALSRVNSYDAMGSLMLGPIGLALAGPLIGAVGLQAAFVVAAVVSTLPIIASLFSTSVRTLRTVTPGRSGGSIAPCP